MEFKDAPVGAILLIANSTSGPVYAKKVKAVAAGVQMAHNAMWVDQNGNILCSCYIMDDQGCEAVTLKSHKEKET